MKKTVKTITLMLLVVAILASMVLPACAAGYRITSGYKSYATCTLKNVQKPGYVTIGISGNTYQMGYTQRNSVRMTNTNGRYIWEENGAIRLNGMREFYLGNNNRAYRIYVKTAYGTGRADFYYPQNVSIKITK